MEAKKLKQLEIETCEGLFRLRGPLDEHANLTPLLNAPAPIRLDLREITHISSVGMRRWLRFIENWGMKGIELIACPPPFVNVLNSAPNALGLDKKKSNVVSVLVPYSCACCSFYEEVETAIRSLEIDKSGIYLPENVCSSCGAETRPVVHRDDYFVFLQPD